jgi:hypothetical protein
MATLIPTTVRTSNPIRTNKIRNCIFREVSMRSFLRVTPEFKFKGKRHRITQNKILQQDIQSYHEKQKELARTQKERFTEERRN